MELFIAIALLCQAHGSYQFIHRPEQIECQKRLSKCVHDDKDPTDMGSLYKCIQKDAVSDRYGEKK